MIEHARYNTNKMENKLTPYHTRYMNIHTTRNTTYTLIAHSPKYNVRVSVDTLMAIALALSYMSLELSKSHNGALEVCRQ